MCLIHKWGKWEQYEVRLPFRRITSKWGLCAAIEQRQRRRCQKCGKAKDETIHTRAID